MKFWFTVIGGIVVVTAISTAVYVYNPEMQTAQPVTVKPEPVISGDLPKAVVADGPKKTMGKVPQLFKSKSVFEIKNDGQAPLELTPGQPNCTCAGIEVAKLKLLPGESTPVTVSWDTKERVGEFTVNAPVATNDPFNKNIAFQVSVDVQQDIKWDPANVNFATISEGKQATQPLRIFSTIHDDLKISEPALSSKSIQAKVEPLSAEELKQLEAKSGAKVTFTVDGTLPVGHFFEKFNFATNLERAPLRSVDIVGDVEGKMVMTPNRVDFGPIVQGQAHERKIEIFAKGLAADDVLKIETIDPKFVTAELVNDPAFKVLWRLKVTVPDNAPGGTFSGYISIADKAGNRKLNLPIKGVVSGAAQTASTAK